MMDEIWARGLGATAGYDMPRRAADCAECSLTDYSRLGTDDNGVLPTRPTGRRS